MNINPLNAVASVADTIVGAVKDYFPSEQKRAEFQASVEKALNDYTLGLQATLTDRWKADDASDSWLAKNTRPLILWALFLLWVVEGGFAVAGHPFPEGYVSLTAQMLIGAMGGYFVMRGAEKIAAKKYA